MTICELYRALEQRIPHTYSCPWDNDGLSCCPDGNAEVRGVLIALDPSEDAVAEAERRGYNFLLTHHPMLFRGLRAVDGKDTASRKILRMARVGIAAAAFHTRLDALPGGVNDTLAATLGLTGVRPFGSGEGEDGNPAGMPMGRIGELDGEESFAAFCERVKSALHTPAVLCADGGRRIRRVAVLGGAGDGEVEAALAAGADAYVTGELRYHQLCDAPYSGMSLIAAGHYHTEFPVTAVLASLVRECAPEIPVAVYGGARVEVR